VRFWNVSSKILLPLIRTKNQENVPQSFLCHITLNLKQSKSISNSNIHNLKHNICHYITKQLSLWKLNHITTNFQNIHYIISQIIKIGYGKNTCCVEVELVKLINEFRMKIWKEKKLDPFFQN
jgi:hypothetical protein